VNKYILIVVFCLSGILYAQEHGYLSLSADQGAEIFIDSVLVANSPFERLALKTGTYNISVYDRQDFSWNKRAIEETIQILPESEVERDYRSKNFRDILSRPTGSEVYLGAIMIGTTPLTLKKETLDGQSITLRKDGYQDKSFSMQDIETQSYLSLNRLDPDENPDVFRASLGGTQVNWFRESLILTSFISSWTAFMFKRKADQNYANYLSSSVPVLMDRYYEEAQKFDRYTEIAIGVSVTAITVYMIWLITE
jgi:hypothetical protein